MIVHAELVWYPLDLAQPDRATARGQPSTRSAVCDLALPPGCGVVALREVEWMPHPFQPAQPQQFL
jgi:hypothetical protein